jgi:hypothetical protein
MYPVDVITTLIKQNMKTWAWHYTDIVPLPNNLGLFFQVKSKFQGYVMILYDPWNNLFRITFYDNEKNKILEKEDVSIHQIIHQIHKEVFVLKHSEEIILYCNSFN